MVMRQATQQPIVLVLDAPDHRRPQILAYKCAWGAFRDWMVAYPLGMLSPLSTVETTGIGIQRHYG